MLPRVKEESVKDKIKQILKEMKVPFDMPPANGYGRAGNFDFVCCVDGAYLGIEAKRDAKEKPTRLQTEHAMEFAEHGAGVLLIHKDNLDLLKKTIEQMRDCMRAMPRRVVSLMCSWPVLPPQADDSNVTVKRKKA
jgi:hypothetical protein